MPDTPEERTYKHQVSADFVLEAITTIEWSPEQTNKFNAKGIYRGFENASTGNVFEETRLTERHDFLFEEKDYILLYDVEVKDFGGIQIDDYKISSKSLVIIRSSISGFRISQLKNSKQEATAKASKPIFYSFFDSNIGSLDLIENKIREISFFNSKVQFLSIRSTSSLEALYLEESDIKHCEVFFQTKINRFSLNQECKIDNLNIQKGEITNFYSLDSTINNISVTDSILEEVELNLSFTGDISL